MQIKDVFAFLSCYSRDRSKPSNDQPLPHPASALLGGSKARENFGSFQCQCHWLPCIMIYHTWKKKWVRKGRRMLGKENYFQALNGCVQNNSRTLIWQHSKTYFGGYKFQMNSNLLTDKAFVAKKHLMVYYRWKLLLYFTNIY